jgi:hypothetical protein
VLDAVIVRVAVNSMVNELPAATVVAGVPAGGVVEVVAVVGAASVVVAVKVVAAAPEVAPLDSD